MPLTPQEQAELDYLNRANDAASGITPQEEKELAQLNQVAGVVPKTDYTALNEMHPDISALSRAAYKNFGNDTASGIEYLKQQNPGLEWRNVNGEIQAKRPGENQWRMLDPGGFQLKDLPQDIGDVAYDIPAGIAQGAAMGAAGLFGGGATGGLGAIPAAMGASATSGAGLEGLRQKIGEYLGINKGVNLGDVATSGAIGAASPLLFGTGAGAKQALSYAAKKGFAQDAANTLISAQRGIPGRVYDTTAGTIGPSVGSLLSGISAPILKTANKMLPDIYAAGSNPEVITNLLENSSQKVTQGINKFLKEKGTAIETAIKDADVVGPVVETKQVLAPVYELLNKLKAERPTEATDATINEIENLLKTNVKTKSKVMPTLSTQDRLEIAAGLKPAPTAKTVYTLPEKLKATDVNDLYFKLKAIAEDEGANFEKSGTAQGVVSTGSKVSKQTQSAFTQATKKAKDELKSLVGSLEENSNAVSNFDADHAAYAEAKDMQKQFQNASNKEESFQRLLAKAQSDAVTEKLVNDLYKTTGVNLPEISKQITALRTFRKPAKDALSLAGTTSTSRTAPLAMAGGALGYYAGQALNQSPFLLATAGTATGSKIASPAALRGIMNINKTLRSPGNIPLNMYQYAPATLENLFKNKKGE